MSDVTLGKALRIAIGYSNDKIVPHRFRAMFSTIAHEYSNFPTEVIEVQLAYKVGSKISQAYNRAKYLQQRQELVQWWGDCLDKYKENLK